jgi:hypothetical protein
VLALELAASWANTGMANKRAPANKNGVRDFIFKSPLCVYVVMRTFVDTIGSSFSVN